MQYFYLHHRNLLQSLLTSTTGCCFCFGSISSFFLELFLHYSPVAYWAPTDLGSSSFSVLFCLFILFRLKWEEVRKTTRAFRYDLNQITYDHTVEVTNRLKGLVLIDRVPEKLWTEVLTLYRRWSSKQFPTKRNAKRQNGCLKRQYK